MKLRALLILPLAVAGCVQTHFGEVVAPNPENWGHDFYWASQSATGSSLCNRDLAEEFLDRFNRRYGPRFQRLREAYLGRYGTPPDFVVVSSCRKTIGSEQRERVEQRRAMSRFGYWLSAAERAVLTPSVD